VPKYSIKKKEKKKPQIANHPKKKGDEYWYKEVAGKGGDRTGRFKAHAQARSRGLEKGGPKIH